MLQHRIDAAMGRVDADLVLKNADYVNVFSNEILHGDIAICDGVIVGIGSYHGKTEVDVGGKIVAPGLIDSHIHLESSLVCPSEFVRAVLPHGTTAVVTDPHEIANVMGIDGLRFMLQATENLPLSTYFMLPSCVPATAFEEAGAVLNAKDLQPWFDHPRVLGLAEMMNAFGVTHCDETVLEKISSANRIDGHAPMLSGKELNAYVAAGIQSDHECSDLDEALEKLRLGQYIMIREGTAAHNLQALSPLLNGSFADRCLLCTDDKHPSDLLQIGHMDAIIRKAVENGANPIAAIRAASRNAAEYFGLRAQGAIAPSYRADLVVFDSLEKFHVEQVYCGGVCQFDGSLKPFAAPEIDKNLTERALHTVHTDPIEVKDLQTEASLAIIGMIDHQLLTTDAGRANKIDVENDILKIAVIERHHHTGHIGICYLKGYGLKQGAVATSISHDSHNIIAVGTNEADMALAVNQLIAQGGGITVANGEITANVPLEIAGLMSQTDLHTVNEALETAKETAHQQGTNPNIDPFMSLSFMSLPVIPTTRLTTKGAVDVLTQSYIS